MEDDYFLVSNQPTQLFISRKKILDRREKG